MSASPGLPQQHQASQGRDRDPDDPGPSAGQRNETAEQRGGGGEKEVDGVKIGVPFENYDISDSICYSHNWFRHKEIEGVPHAECLLCLHAKEAARAAGKPPSSSRKKKQDCLKTLTGTTKRKFDKISF